MGQSFHNFRPSMPPGDFPPVSLLQRQEQIWMGQLVRLERKKENHNKLLSKNFRKSWLAEILEIVKFTYNFVGYIFQLDKLLYPR